MCKMKLTDLGNIPFDVSVLDTVYPENRAIVAKADRLEKSGDVIRLKRGVYVVHPEISGKKINEFLIANHLYGPSYVSKQSALRFYGLIPERVYELTSMTTRLAKSYSNQVAKFTYAHCPEEYFSLGIVMQEEDGVNYLIASPEKALCDLMIYTPHLNLRFMKDLRQYLEYDIRFDMAELPHLNLELLHKIMDRGKKKQMIAQLMNLINNERNI